MTFLLGSYILLNYVLGQPTDRDLSTNLGMISYQGPAGACDGQAQVTLGYKFGG